MLAVAAAVGCAAAGCAGGASSEPGSDRAQPGRVVRIVDGDTLLVSMRGRIERVRLLGIDTPESVRPGTAPECGSKRAGASLARLAPRGAAVEVRTDAGSGDVRDGYGRLLAFVTAAGRDLGLAQVRRGWARVYAYRDRRFTDRERYERAFRRARHRNRGAHACL
jgi:micrococcal nuclease